MKTFKLKYQRPESKIQKAIIAMLQMKGWFVRVVHGNMYQEGFPDLYCTHSKYGIRWVEVKLPDMKGSKFTTAQLDMFPKMIANGSPIWILTTATEAEYNLLFKRSNYYQFTEVWRK